MTSHIQRTTAPVIASQLIPVFLSQIGGIPAYVCDARKLHTYLENGDLFANWIKARIEKYGFEGNRDFHSFLEKTKKPKGGRPSTEYHLTLDMAKELSMVENNTKGRQARRYFIEMEKKALAASGQVVLPSHQETLLPSEQQILSEIVHKRAEVYGELQGKVLSEIWSRVHRKFRVSRYSQLRRTQLSEAILYVIGLEIRKGKSLLPTKLYNYPRKLLEQPHFTIPKIPASLGISMLADTQEFVSPLFALLNELRTDGHNVSAPWDEAVAMREAIQRADKAMKETLSLMWNSRFAAASTAGGGDHV
jgi:phage anti-repressor protein